VRRWGREQAARIPVWPAGVALEALAVALGALAAWREADYYVRSDD
jgi:hypothetical protein